MRARLVQLSISMLLLSVLGLPIAVLAESGSISVTQNNCSVTLDVTITDPEPNRTYGVFLFDGSQVHDVSSGFFSAADVNSTNWSTTIPDDQAWTAVVNYKQDNPEPEEDTFGWVTTKDLNACDPGSGSGGGDNGSSGGNTSDDDDSSEPQDSRPGPAFNPGDSRLNREAGAPVAVYCEDANDRLSIYAIDPATGIGSLAALVPYSSFADDGNGSNNILLNEGGLMVFQAVEGSWVVRSQQFDGKWYQFSFSGCPYAGDGWSSHVS